MTGRLFTAAAMVSSLLLSGIATAELADGKKFPDVVEVNVGSSGPDLFDFEVTLSSPYDTPQRYADAFRISNSAGVVFGERVLLHDHADEQPFMRDLRHVRIPKGVRMVVVQGRDKKYGYGGKTKEVLLPGR